MSGIFEEHNFYCAFKLEPELSLICLSDSQEPSILIPSYCQQECFFLAIKWPYIVLSAES